MSRPLLVALAPAGETRVVTTLRPSTRLDVVRRCVDVADLLGAAAAGVGRAVLVGADMPGLDRSTIAELVGHGLAVVGVAAADDQERFLRQIGVGIVVGSGADLSRLEEAVDSAHAARGRRPPGTASAPDDLGGLGSLADPAPGDSVTLGELDHLLAAGLGADLLPERRSAPRPTTPPAAPAGRAKALPPHAAADVAEGTEEDPAPGRIVAVWGPTGAPGRTTLAVNLAAEFSELGIDTLLVDADPYGGVVAALLALVDEAPGLAAAVRASEQGLLDAPALAALTPQVAPLLRVLTGLPRADRWIELRPAGVGHVLGVARLVAGLIVVDCGFNLEDDEELSYDTLAPRRNAATLAALEAADDIVVVGSGDPIGLQRLVRGLQELDGHRAPGHRHVVVNRVRAAAVGPGPEERIRAALIRFAGLPDCHLIPDDRPALDAVTLAGRTLAEAARSSPARSAVAALAAELSLPATLPGSEIGASAALVEPGGARRGPTGRPGRPPRARRRWRHRSTSGHRRG